MGFIWDGIKQAADLIVHGDHDILVVVATTLRVALFSTLIALALGLPLGLALGLGRFRGRRAGLALANAGMGLPPVVVGLVAALLLFRGAPLGGLNMLYTLNGVIAAQTLLALPVVAALTAAAVQALPAGLPEQARAVGAARAQVAVLALREVRVGVLAATIAAMGSAFAEVGAIVLVGGNLEGETQTLASAVLVRVSAGEYGRAIALGTILLGLILVLAAGLTLAPQHERRALLGRPSGRRPGRSCAPAAPAWRGRAPRSCATSTSTCTPARSSCSSDPTVPESRRCCTRSAGSCRSRGARS